MKTLAVCVCVCYIHGAWYTAMVCMSSPSLDSLRRLTHTQGLCDVKATLHRGSKDKQPAYHRCQYAAFSINCQLPLERGYTLVSGVHVITCTARHDSPK